MNSRPQGTKEANGLKSERDFSPFANSEFGIEKSRRRAAFFQMMPSGISTAISKTSMPQRMAQNFFCVGRFAS